MRQLLFAGTIAAVSVASGAQAVTFGNLYAFGDSLADCCFLGRFTQGDTPTWVDLLPERIGATYVATPETNLAVGGAQSGPTNVVPSTDVSFGFPTGYASQIARFVSSPAASTVGPTDIAAIWVGTNDIWAAAFSGSPSPIGPINTAFDTPPSPEALAAYISYTIAEGVADLRDLGFGSVAIVSPYDIGNTAFVVTEETRPLVSEYSIAVRDMLASLHTPGIDTYFLDMVSLLDTVQEDAEAFGFDFLTGAESCDAGAAAALGGTATCIDLPTAEQDRYVFADFIHLTNATNVIIADELGQIINEGRATPAPVPLPASALLLVGAMAGLGFLRSVRRKET